MNAPAYTREMMKLSVAKLISSIGWHTSNVTPLEILTDIATEYMIHLCKTTKDYANAFGYTDPTVDHVALAFHGNQVNMSELVEYVTYVDFAPAPNSVPMYPIPKESDLNFLKPGSKECLTRPIHVHEHLPPMWLQQHEPPDQGTSGKPTELQQNQTMTRDGGGGEDNKEHQLNGTSTPTRKEQLGDLGYEIFKRPVEISAGDTPKKGIFEEGGRPTREISSVIMTTSGYISPAREGRLPDSMTPPMHNMIPESTTSLSIAPQHHHPTSHSGLSGGDDSAIITDRLSTASANHHHVPPGGVTASATLPPTPPTGDTSVAGTIMASNLPITPVSSGPKKPRTKRSDQHRPRNKGKAAATFGKELFKPDTVTTKVRKTKDHAARSSQLKKPAVHSSTPIVAQPLTSGTVPPPIIACISPDIVTSLPPSVTITTTTPASFTNKQKVSKTLAAARQKTEKLNTTITPIPPVAVPLPTVSTPDAVVLSKNCQASGSTNQQQLQEGSKVGKLFTEPDKVKMDIFKKISKGSDKTSPQKGVLLVEGMSTVTSSNRIEPIMEQMKQYSSMDDVTIELVDSPTSKTSTMTHQQPHLLSSTVMAATSSTSVEHSSYFDDDSPPGTPSTPKTPEMVSRSPPPTTAANTKRKRKDKEKERKPKKVMKLSRNPSPRHWEDDAVSTSEQPIRPKTPEGPSVPSIKVPPQLGPNLPFPFLASFSGPGLIPNAMFPAIPNFLPHPPYGAVGGFPTHLGGVPPHIMAATPLHHPPKPLQMPASMEATSAKTISLLSPHSTTSSTSSVMMLSPSGIASSAVGRPKSGGSGVIDLDSEPGTPSQSKSGKPDKKSKEHKKEKKEKDKVKKKNKKDRMKNKLERKKLKEELKKGKEKLRKERKEKKREQRENRFEMEISIPKLTLKIGTPSPRPVTPDAKRPGIKQVLVVKESGNYAEATSTVREQSPELARILPLVTGQPKQKPSKDETVSHPAGIVTASATTDRHLDEVGGAAAATAYRPPAAAAGGLLATMAAATSTTAPIAAIAITPPANRPGPGRPRIHPIKQKPPAATLAKSSTAGRKIAATLAPSAANQVKDAQGNEVWICPGCGLQDDGRPMIGCDDCDAWYHWVCVNIQVPPEENENWYCLNCIKKKQNNQLQTSEKKKKRKKKDKRKNSITS